MAKKLNFINIFLNNSKNSCLSLIKFLKRRKLPLHNVNSEKIDTSAGNSTFNGKWKSEHISHLHGHLFSHVSPVILHLI